MADRPVNDSWLVVNSESVSNGEHSLWCFTTR